MDAWSLGRSQCLWVERCARKLMSLNSEFEYACAVGLAFDLLLVWPELAPGEAAAALVSLRI